MKLPKRKEKFIVDASYEGEECSFYGFVVSGVHIELWGDDNNPDFVWYCVCADKVYDGLFRGRCLHVALCLEHALDFIAEHLLPYEEPEEKAEEEPITEEGTSDGRRISESASGVLEEKSATGVLEESGALAAVDYSLGKFSGAVENVFGVPDRLGGVSYD